MAKKKAKKAKAAKRPAKAKKAAKKKVAKKVAKKAAKKKSAKKKPVAKKAVAKKKVAKKAVKKKAVAKKTVAKKAAVKKAAPKKAAPKKTIAAKSSPKKTVMTTQAPEKKSAPKPVKPAVKEKEQANTVVQQEASHSEHRESFTPHVTRLKAGDPAPDFSGVDQDGNKVSLEDFKDKTLVLYFYPKDDTEGCTAESCSLRDEYQYLQLHNHAVVGVSADDVSSHKHFAEKYNLQFPLIADTDMEIIKAYDVWGKKRLFDHIYDGIVRTTFIIRDNTIQRVITSVNTKNHGKQVMEA